MILGNIDQYTRDEYFSFEIDLSLIETRTIALNIINGKGTIHWGDEAISFVNASPTNYFHTYSGSNDIFVIRVSGYSDQLKFVSVDTYLALTKILEWGKVKSVFDTNANRPNLTSVPEELGEHLITLAHLFTGATAFNQPIGNWDVSNVTNMAYMFNDARVFNQPLNNWDTSNVVNFSGMFENAWGFNDEIDTWDTSNATIMSRMFATASIFNQDISGWDVSNVTSMANMFQNASAFDQDISGWDTGTVTAMTNMFRDARVFNQDLSSWCVSKISSKPTGFDTNTSAWVLPQPVWGTCPGG